MKLQVSGFLQHFPPLISILVFQVNVNGGQSFPCQLQLQLGAGQLLQLGVHEAARGKKWVFKKQN